MRSSGWAPQRTGVLIEREVWTHTDTHTHREGIQKTHRKKLAMGLECCTYA